MMEVWRICLVLLLTASFMNVDGASIDPMVAVAVEEGKAFVLTCDGSCDEAGGTCWLEKKLENGEWCTIHFSSKRDASPLCPDSGQYNRTQDHEHEHDIIVTVSDAQFSDAAIYRCRLSSNSSIYQETSVVVLRKPVFISSRHYATTRWSKILCSLEFATPGGVDETKVPSLKLTVNGVLKYSDVKLTQKGKKILKQENKYSMTFDGAEVNCSAFTLHPPFEINSTQYMMIIDVGLAVGLSLGLGIPVIVGVVIAAIYCCYHYKTCCWRVSENIESTAGNTSSHTDNPPPAPSIAGTTKDSDHTDSLPAAKARVPVSKMTDDETDTFFNKKGSMIMEKLRPHMGPTLLTCLVSGEALTSADKIQIQNEGNLDSQIDKLLSLINDSEKFDKFREVLKKQGDTYLEVILDDFFQAKDNCPL